MQYNILVINWQDITNPLGGGAEVHLHEIFRRVVAKGHKVTLLCCRHAGAADEEYIDGIRIIRKGGRNTFNFIVPSAYCALAKHQRFDVVFDDINKIPFFTPLFVSEPLIAIAHHFFGRSIFIEAAFPLACYVFVSERLVPSVYDRVPFAVVSQSTRRELENKGVRSKINLLPNAVDLSRYGVIENGKNQTPLVGYFGRLKKYKSIDHFVRAIPDVLTRFPNAQFLIVGEGDNRQNLEKLACILGINDKVQFTGAVSQREKVVLLNRMWIAVNPSPKEGWGLTVIEANACQTPVIAANSPGLVDSVIHKKTGLLYKFGNIEQLTKSINLLLDNEKLRINMGVAARKWAEEFNWDNSAELAIKIISETLNRRK